MKHEFFFNWFLYIKMLSLGAVLFAVSSKDCLKWKQDKRETLLLNIAQNILLAHYTSHGRPPDTEDEDGLTRLLLTAEHSSRRRFQGSRD